MTERRPRECHGMIHNGYQTNFSSSMLQHRHDDGMHIVGQPARDLSRHFTERSVYHLYLQAEANYVVQMESSPQDQGSC